MKLNVCPSTLQSGYDTFSPAAQTLLFDGRKVDHVLLYSLVSQDEDDLDVFFENRQRLSMSGVQDKYSLVFDDYNLWLTAKGQQGTHILKPIPHDLKKASEVPANEHLTMQIAAQVFGIHTAANGLVFFQNSQPAYITKRFDVKKNGQKWQVEDLAAIAGKSKGNGDINFKYEGSYEWLGNLIHPFVSAEDIERFFSLIVFNYLFSNGDAHLKNFSLIEKANGGYELSPAYDLVNTRLHVDDSDFALEKGLFEDGYKSPSFQKNGHPSHADFTELGKRLGLAKEKIDTLLQPFTEKHDLIDTLIQASFLKEATKRGYLLLYQTKKNYLNDANSR